MINARFYEFLFVFYVLIQEQPFCWRWFDKWKGKTKTIVTNIVLLKIHHAFLLCQFPLWKLHYLRKSQQKLLKKKTYTTLKKWSIMAIRRLNVWIASNQEKDIIRVCFVRRSLVGSCTIQGTTTGNWRGFFQHKYLESSGRLLRSFIR